MRNVISGKDDEPRPGTGRVRSVRCGAGHCDPRCGGRATGAIGAMERVHWRIRWGWQQIYILEKAGALTALDPSLVPEPLTAVSDFEFRFPAFGSHSGENATFLRDAQGKVSALKVGAVVFPRRQPLPRGKSSRSSR